MPSWDPDLVNKLILYRYVEEICRVDASMTIALQKKTKRHLESMLKGIKSYLCLVQTGHVDVEGILFGTWKGIRAFG
jgi:hypothetical protein